MEAAGSEAQDRVALLDGGAVDQLAPLRQTDAETGHIEFPRRVEPGHLGHLPADERAPRLAAAFGHAGHDTRHLGGQQPADGDVVEEEDGTGPDREDVVYRHRHQVDADGVETAGLLREQQLGADAVGGRHQHGLLQAAGKLEHPGEAPDGTKHSGDVGALGVGLDQADGLLPRLDVHPGLPVAHVHRVLGVDGEDVVGFIEQAPPPLSTPRERRWNSCPTSPVSRPESPPQPEPRCSARRSSL